MKPKPTYPVHDQETGLFLFRTSHPERYRKPAPTPEEMRVELEVAGWTKYRGNSTIWLSPWGALFRGPAKAWEIMRAVTEPS